MKTSLRFILIVVVILLNSIDVRSQITIDPATQTVVCTTNTIPISISGQTSDFTLGLNLDAIVGPDILHEYICHLTSTTINPVFKVEIFNANCSFVQVTNPPVTCDYAWDITGLPVGDITFNLKITIDCNIVELTGINGVSNITMRQDWLNVNTSTTMTVNGTTPFDCPILYPFISNEVQNQSINANYLGENATNHKDLIFQYKNTGSAPVNMVFSFEDNNTCPGSYTKVSFDYEIANTGGTLTFPNSYIEGQNFSSTVPEGYSIYIRERVNVIGCQCTSGSVTFSWKCDFGPASTFNECTECQHVYESQFNLPRIGDYTVNYNITSPSSDDRRFDHACANTFTDYEIVIINDGDNAIEDFKLTLMYLEGVKASTIELINKSSIELDLGAFTTDIEDEAGNPVTLSATNNFPSSCFEDLTIATLCTTDVNEPFENLKFHLKDFLVNQTCTLDLRLFRCVENDNALMNSTKFLNQWEHIWALTDECGDGVPSQGLQASFLGGQDQIDLELHFTPITSDLTAFPPPGVPCPQLPPYTIEEIFSDNSVKLNDFAQAPASFGIVGSIAPNDLTNLKGILRVHVHTDRGLKVDYENVDFSDPGNPVVLNLTGLFSNGGIRWIPIQNQGYLNTNTTGCEDVDYYYYYDLFTPPPGATAEDLLENGEFKFRLVPCCTALEGSSTYDVDFHLMVDPVDGSSCEAIMGSPGNYNINSSNYTDFNDDDYYDWLPLSTEGDAIAIHCPGCLAPGIIVDEYEMVRSDNSYGLPDMDNDRLADDSDPIDISNYTPPQPLNKNVSMHGDFIEDRLVAHFQNGDNSINPCNPQGYTYADMCQSNPFALDYLFLDKTFSNDAFVTMGLQIQSVTVYIDEPFATPNANDCMDCELFPTTFNNFRTQLKYEYIPASGTIDPWIPNPSDGNVIHFKFQDDDFESALPGSGVTITQGTGPDFSIEKFEVNQRYRMIVRYSVCGNFNSFENPDGGILETQIQNAMYLTGDDITPYTEPPMPNTLNDVLSLSWSSPSDPGFSDSYQFFCERHGGRHTFVSNDYGTNLTKYENEYRHLMLIPTCDFYFKAYFTSTIGGGSSYDFFPYEVRRPVYLPNEWILQGTDLAVLSISSTCSTYYGQDPPLLFQISESENINCVLPCTLHVADMSIPSQLPNAAPYIECLIDPDPTTASAPQSSNELAIGDQYFKIFNEFDLDIVGGVECNVNTDLIVSCQFSDESIGYCNTTNAISSCSGSTTDPIFTVPPQAGGGPPDPGIPMLNLNNPNLKITVYSPIQSVETHEVRWEIDLENKYDINLGTTSAYNVFLDLSSCVGFLNNIVFLPDGVGAIAIPFDINNRVILESDLGIGLAISGKIIANYYSCVSTPNNHVPVELKWGWDCEGVPSPSNTQLCQLETEQLEIINTGTGFSIITTPATTYNLCDGMTMSATVQSSNVGDMYPESISILNMPPGLTLVGPPIVTILGTQVTLGSPVNNTWPIQLPPSGIPYALTQSGEQIVVTLNCTTDCDYLGFQPSIAFGIVNYCYDPLSIVADFPGILSPGANMCTNCFTITKVASTPIVPINTLMNFTIEICNNNPPSVPTVSAVVTDVFPPSPPFNFISSDIPVGPISFPSGTCYTYTVVCSLSTAGNYVNQANLDIPGNLTESAFAPVTIVPNCGFPVTQIQLNNATVQNLQINGYPPNTTLFIEGTFTVNGGANSSFKFNGCTIFMGAGAEIIVEPGFKLVLEDTKIYACTDMWKGIRVRGSLLPGGILYPGTLKSSHSWICDAEYGVYTEDYSASILESTNFYRNYVGIYMPTNPLGFNSISMSISDCEFNTNGVIRPEYSTQTQTDVGTKTFAGIVAHDAYLDLSSALLPSTRFIDLSNGIIGRQLDISLQNCIFKDINPDIFYGPNTNTMVSGNFFNGSAIYVVGRGQTIKQIGLGKAAAPTFDNCRFGLFAERMNVRSTENNMRNVFNGYRVNFGSNMEIDVLTNHIESRSTAIDLRLNDNARHLFVDNNEIYFGEFMTGFFRGVNAIQAVEQNGHNFQTHIHNNDIYYNPGANNATGGISVSSASDYFITENHLFMDDNQVNRNGIITSGCNVPEVSCNFVYGTHDWTANSTQSAITNVMGTNPIISCNFVNGTMNGIRMLGDAGVTAEMRGNEFNNHNIGLFYDNGVTNPMQLRGNLWLESPVNLFWGAFSDNNFAYLLFPYEYDNANAPTNKSFEPTSTINGTGFDPSLWFVSVNDINDVTFECLDNNNDFYCDQFPPCPGCPIDVTIHERIAQNDIENDPYTEETLWRLKMSLYEYLKTDSLLLTDSLFQTFYDSIQFTVMGQLEQLSEEQYEILQLDQSVITNLVSNRIALENYMALLGEKMELYRQAIDAGTTTTGILIDINNIQQSIKTISDYNRNVFDIADNSSTLTADNISAVNASLYTSDVIEQNEQTVNEIYLSTVSEHTVNLNTNTISQLEFVAYQCPLSGGNSVFEARGLLSLVSDEYQYDDVNICLQNGVVIRQLAKKPKANLFPNPANNSVTLLYEFSEDGPAELYLFNSVGQLQNTYLLDTSVSSITFSTTHLKPGIYHYKVISPTDDQINGKLVILH